MPNPTQHQLLFNNNTSNLLPCNGHVNYFGKILSDEEILHYFNELYNTIAWKNDEVIIFGKLIKMTRKVAWYATSNIDYTYSNISKKALPFTPTLLSLKQIIEQKTGETYNACLLNLYENGSEGMGWHSDDEKELDSAAPIASVSLGGTRKFAFKHKLDKTSVSLFLEDGSVLLMQPPTQEFWQHSLTKTKRPVAPRINLTFRAIRQDDD